MVVLSRVVVLSEQLAEPRPRNLTRVFTETFQGSATFFFETIPDEFFTKSLRSEQLDQRFPER